jgi:cyclohexa-1,5-dienecarbonyl-CoA hydratase
VTAPVQLAIDASGVRASIRLFHPKGNIITVEMIDALDRALETVSDHPHLKLLTIEGSGADFSFGASIPEHSPGAIERVLPATHALIERLLAAPAPTAALVRGRCLGGGFEIALACDFIFAEASATFGLPEIALGVFPPAACVLLPARAGAARATRAILTGAPSPADEWRQAGLVTEVSADGMLAGDVDRWFTDHLVGRSAEALRHAVAAARHTLRDDVRRRLPELERLYLDVLMKTADAREGVTAFLEKRLPDWNDR